MKTTLTLPNESPSPPLKFPLLARSKHNQVVVLFTEEHTGTVVKDGIPEAHEKLGHHSQGWTACSYDVSWEILPSGTKLVIEQEL